MWSSYVVPDIISYAGIITSVIVALRSAAPFLQSLYSSNENSNYFFNFYWYYGIHAVLPLNRLLRSHKGVLMSLPFMSDHVISCVHLVATKSHQYYFTRSDTAQIDLTIHIISYWLSILCENHIIWVISYEFCLLCIYRRVWRIYYDNRFVIWIISWLVLLSFAFSPILHDIQTGHIPC